MSSVPILLAALLASSAPPMAAGLPPAAVSAERAVPAGPARLSVPGAPPLRLCPAPDSRAPEDDLRALYRSGLTYGAVLADVFLLGLRQISGFILQKQLPVTAMAVSFFLAILVALGAALYPAVRAGRVNIVEAIKNE